VLAACPRGMTAVALESEEGDTPTSATSPLEKAHALLAKLTDPSSIRLYACPLLVLQNSALFLVMKSSTSLHEEHYHTTVAVLMQEIVKLSTCLLLLAISARSVAGPVLQLWELRRNMLGLLIPVLAYTGQNNLLYVGVSRLPAAVAQVLVQTKLLWAAVFSILMLRKRFSVEAWCSFVILVSGVVLVKNGDSAKSHAGPPANTTLDDSSGASDLDPGLGAALVGVLASVAAAGLSGFAGVYLEKTFNKGNASLLQMNVYLALFSLPPQLIVLLLFSREAIASTGVFYGFHADTVGVILIQAVGGLLTAVVIKFAGNILKGFATAIALLSTSLLAIPLFHFRPSAIFWVGLVAVSAATMMYSTNPVTTLVKRCTQPELLEQSRQLSKLAKVEAAAEPIVAAEEGTEKA